MGKEWEKIKLESWEGARSYRALHGMVKTLDFTPNKMRSGLYLSPVLKKT